MSSSFVFPFPSLFSRKTRSPAPPSGKKGSLSQAQLQQLRGTGQKSTQSLPVRPSQKQQTPAKRPRGNSVAASSLSASTGYSTGATQGAAGGAGVYRPAAGAGGVRRKGGREERAPAHRRPCELRPPAGGQAGGASLMPPAPRRREHAIRTPLPPLPLSQAALGVPERERAVAQRSASATRAPMPVHPQPDRSRRYSELYVPAAAHAHHGHVPHHPPPASYNGHEPVHVHSFQPPSAGSRCGGPEWTIEEGASGNDCEGSGTGDSDEYDEDSEGPLDPLEVLESLYDNVPLPPWMAEALDREGEREERVLGHAEVPARAHVESTAHAAGPTSPVLSPTFHVAQRATNPPVDTAVPPSSPSGVSGRTGQSNPKDPRSPHGLRTPITLPFPLRLHRSPRQPSASDTLGRAVNTVVAADAGGHSRAAKFGYPSGTTNERSEPAVPIHQRPLPPVPVLPPRSHEGQHSPTSTQGHRHSFRHRLLRGKHAGDGIETRTELEHHTDADAYADAAEDTPLGSPPIPRPFSPSAPISASSATASTPLRHRDRGLPLSAAPSRTASTSALGSTSGYTTEGSSDALSISAVSAGAAGAARQPRPLSVVNHIIPPDERARIGRRRADSASSTSSFGSSFYSHTPSAHVHPLLVPRSSTRTLVLPPAAPSLPGSPFGAGLRDRPLPTGFARPAGLNPPPRPRSRMHTGSVGAQGNQGHGRLDSGSSAGGGSGTGTTSARTASIVSVSPAAPPWLGIERGVTLL